MAFPAFHGSNGEDGTFQGMMELLNVPYVGCGVLSSSIAMDKVITKQLLNSQNIPTPKFITFNENDWKNNKEKSLEEITKI